MSAPVPGDGAGTPGDPSDRDPDREHGAARPWQALGVWWIGVAGLVVATVLMLTQNLRLFGYAVGATMGVLAVLRAVLPEQRAGGLRVRSRMVDVLTLSLLGLAIGVLASALRLDV